MSNIEFEQAILKVMEDFGYIGKDLLVQKMVITIECGQCPLVDIDGILSKKGSWTQKDVLEKEGVENE